MKDAAVYAINLLTTINSTNAEVVVNELFAISNVIGQKKAAMEQLGTKEIANLLSSLSAPVQQLVQQLHHHRQLRLITKIVATFKRMAEKDGYQIVEITAADPEKYRELIKKQYGDKSIIVTKTDFNLIAGLRITTSQQSCEMSINSQLNRIKQAIAT